MLETAVDNISTHRGLVFIDFTELDPKAVVDTSWAGQWRCLACPSLSVTWNHETAAATLNDDQNKLKRPETHSAL
jgi:hypothetical protein